MVNIYDRIIKEVIELLLLPLSEIALNLLFVGTKEIKDKIHATLEREGDHFKMLLFSDPSNDCILHLEFHVKDEDIGKVMLLKKSMLLTRFDKEVRQFVIYMGKKKRLSHLKNHYTDSKTRHRFEVVYLNKIDYKKFLAYNLPEVVIFAILADFGKKSPKEVIHEIVARLDSLTAGTSGADRHIVRLEVLSNLRNLRPQTVKIINDMAFSFSYDILTDPRYVEGRKEGKKEGREEGREKGREEGIVEGIEKGVESKTFRFVCNLIAAGTFSEEQIGSLADVSIAYIHRVKAELEKNPKAGAKAIPIKTRKKPSVPRKPASAKKTTKQPRRP